MQPPSPRRAVAVALVVLLVTPLFVGVAAADERVGGTIVVDEGETVDALQATGGSVVVRGTVNGDLEAFAGSVNVAESGTVTGDVTGAAGSVRIAGTVEGGLDVGAGSLDITETGVVRGDVNAGAGSFTFAGTVDGSARVGAGSISLSSTAQVGSDFVYDGDIVVADGATISGELREDPDIAASPFSDFPSIPGWVFTLYSLLLTVLVGAILLVAFPGASETVAAGPIDRPLRTLGAGFAALVGVPMLSVLLFVTVVGIPIGILAIFLYVLLVLVAFVLGEYAVGAWLLSLADRQNRWLALLVGVAAVYAVGRVQILGGLVEFLVLLVGLGGVATIVYRWIQGRRGADGPGTTDDARSSASDDTTDVATSDPAA